MPGSRIDHLLLLKRLFRLTRVFFKGRETRKARIFLAALAALSLAIGLVQIVMSYAARDFITTLTQRDHAGWIRAMWRYIGTFALRFRSPCSIATAASAFRFPAGRT